MVVHVSSNVCRLIGLDPKEVTKILSSKGKERHWQSALQIFQSICEARSRVNLYHFNTTISACQRSVQWQLALALFETVPKKLRLLPDVVSYNITLSSCEKGRQWQLAVWLLNTMPRTRTRLRPDSISYSAAMSSCEAAGRWQLALDLFHQMSILKVSQDMLCFSTAISTCAKSSQWQLALKLFADCLLGSTADVVIYNATMEACQRVSHWKSALLLFEQVEQLDSFQPSAASFSTLISCFEKAAEWSLALDFLQKYHFSSNQKIQTPKTPNLIIFNSALSACAAASQWELTLDLLETISKAHLVAVAWLAWCIFRFFLRIALLVTHQSLEAIETKLVILSSKNPGEDSPVRQSKDQLSFNNALISCRVGLQWQRALRLGRDISQITQASQATQVEADLSNLDLIGSLVTLPLNSQAKKSLKTVSFINVSESWGYDAILHACDGQHIQISERFRSGFTEAVCSTLRVEDFEDPQMDQNWGFGTAFPLFRKAFSESTDPRKKFTILDLKEAANWSLKTNGSKKGLSHLVAKHVALVRSTSLHFEGSPPWHFLTLYLA